MDSIPEDYEGRDEIIEMTERRSLLGRCATFEDLGNAAVFAASDWARALTATQLNITCGTEID